MSSGHRQILTAIALTLWIASPVAADPCATVIRGPNPVECAVHLHTQLSSAAEIINEMCLAIIDLQTQNIELAGDIRELKRALSIEQPPFTRRPRNPFIDVCRQAGRLKP